MTRRAHAVRAVRLLVVCTALLTSTPPATAWGPKGHRVIGELAWSLLGEDARKAVSAVLEGETLADVSNWADQVRDQRPETKGWHFVNIAPGATGYDKARDCPPESCIVEKLGEFAKQWKDESLPLAQRREALKWVVHLAGDLHQPLHCALAADRGGNEIKVKFFGQETNLHKVWDSEVIERFDLDSTAYARELSHELTPERIAGWKKGTIAEWADESWRLANSCAYVDDDGRPLANGAKLERGDWLRMGAVIDKQLMKSAVRLAALLER